MESKKIVADEIPEDFRCAITGQVMFDPVVVVKSEVTYEREAILTWFEKNNTDPQTGVVLDAKTIIDNRTLKRVIDQYLTKHLHLYEDENLVYLPNSLKRELLRSIDDSNLQLFRDCLSKHPGLLSVALNDKNETIIDILLAKKQPNYIEKYLLKLFSFRGKAFSARLSRYRDHYREFCRILVLSQEENASKALEQLLLDCKQDELDRPDKKGLCLVHYAAIAGNLTHWQLIIARGADSLNVVDRYKDGYGYGGRLNPFMIACAKGFTNITAAYLSAPAKVNLSATTSYYGEEVKEVKEVSYFAENCTAAQLAAFHGHQAVLEQLISQDPEILFQNSNDVNEGKLTLLDFAILGNQCKTVSWLIAVKKFNENPELDKQKSFLRAVQVCHKEIVLLLLEEGFGPNEFKNLLHDALGFVSYHYRYKARKKEEKHKPEKFKAIYQTLIKLGADLDARVDGDHLIHVAARNGLSEIVIFLLQAGVKSDIENEEGKTILRIAVEEDNVDLFNQLMRYSVNIHSVDSDGNTLLHLARSEEILNALLSKGVDINSLNKFGRSPLFDHIRKRKFNTAQYLLQRNADISIIDKDGKSALFYVCSEDQIHTNPLRYTRYTLLKSILAKNPDVKIFSKYGNTVLHMCTNIRIIEMIVNYLKQGFSSSAEIVSFLNAQNKDGDTALMLVCNGLYRDPLTASFLLEHGADPKLVNKNGKQAIHFLFENINYNTQSKLAFAQRLLDEGVNVNTPINQDGAQLLHIAVEKNSESAVKWLLEHGASKFSFYKVQEDLYQSAVEFTLRCQNKSLLNVFLDSGYDVNHKPSKHSYALIHWAVQHNCEGDIIDLLIDRKADIELANAQGFTPLLLAAKLGHLSPFNYLIKKGASLTKVNSSEMNILHLIASEGRVLLLEPLKSVDITSLVDAKDADGFTPVYHAAKSKQLAVLKSLVTDFKASLEILGPHGDSVLDYGIESGDNDICGYLLDQQSLTENITNEGNDLLFRAIKSKVSDSICERVAGFYIDLNYGFDDYGWTPLHRAAEMKRYQFMRTLICLGVKLDETYKKFIYKTYRFPECIPETSGIMDEFKLEIGEIDITAFYQLIMNLKKYSNEDINENSEIITTIELFIIFDTNPIIHSHKYESLELQILDKSELKRRVEGKCHLLTTLVEKEYVNLVKLFVQSGVNVESIDKEWPLLQYPAASGSLELANLLLEHGAIIDIESNYNPIVIAAAYGHQHLVELFITKFPSCVAIPGKIKPNSTEDYLNFKKETCDDDDEFEVIRHSELSALHAAILEDHDELIPFLVQKAVPIDIMCQGLTPIQLAIMVNSPSAISKLLEHAPNLFVLREGSKTLLHLMVEYAGIKTIELFDKDLLRKWADIADAMGDRPLLCAAKYNEKVVLEYLLKLSVNSNARGAQNKTALHHTVIQNRDNLVQLLLDNRADPSLQDSDGRCALHYVKSLSAVRLLLAHSDAQKCINLQDEYGNTPLHLSRSLDVVSELLEHGANPAIENKKGENALFALLADSTKPKDRFKIAEKLSNCNIINAYNTAGKAIIHVVCENNDLEAVEWVCNNDADVDARTLGFHSDTPIIIAVVRSFDNILRALIKFGADVNKPGSKYSLTPLAESIRFSFRSTKITQLLLNHISVDVVNSLDDSSALYYAISSDDAETFKAFQNHGISIEITDSNGKNILHYIAENNAIKIYQCLTTEQIAKLNTPDNHGNSPLQRGLESNNEKICELLLSTRQMINQTNNQNETILHAAIKSCVSTTSWVRTKGMVFTKSRVSSSLLDKILKSGVDIDAKDNSGNTPLIQCALSKQYDRVKYLINHGCKIAVTNQSNQSVLTVLCEQIDENVQKDSEIYSAIELILKAVNKDDWDTKRCLRSVIFKNSIVVTQLFEQQGLKLADIDNEKTLLLPLDGQDNQALTLNIAMLSYLIQQGVNVKHADFPLGCYILFYLVGASNFDVICMLVENGADVNQVMSENGKTTTLLTILCGAGAHNKDVTEDKIYPMVVFLLDKGADLNYLDHDGNSSLHLAATSNFTEIAKLLIDRGANTKLRNNKGQTPMKAARKAKHDLNYLYIHIDQRERKQKNEVTELQKKVAVLEKQNEILKNCFAHYRRMTEAELQALKEKEHRYNPRLVGNFSSQEPFVGEVSEQVAEQQSHNRHK